MEMTKEKAAKAEVKMNVTKVANMYELAEIIHNIDIAKTGEIVNGEIALGTKSISPNANVFMKILAVRVPELAVSTKTEDNTSFITLNGDSREVEFAMNLFTMVETHIMSLVKETTDGKRSTSVALKKDYYKDLFNEVSAFEGVEIPAEEPKKKSHHKKVAKPETKAAKEETSAEPTEPKAPAGEPVEVPENEFSDDDFLDDTDESTEEEIKSRIATVVAASDEFEEDPFE